MRKNYGCRKHYGEYLPQVTGNSATNHLVPVRIDVPDGRHFMAVSISLLSADDRQKELLDVSRT